jgi:predicted MFS family arabinose efflux permease
VIQRRASLWQHRDFLKLWAGHTISVFGTRLDALTFVALITLAASPAQLGLLNATLSVGVLAVALFVGVWVDRLRRRPVMIAADAGRALLLGSVPLAALFGWLSLAQVFIVAALMGALNVCFDVADHSHLPTLVEREQIVEGNSKLEASANVVEIIAPAAGGGLVQLLTAPFAVLADALTFVASAISIALIRKPEPSPLPRQSGENVWHEISVGLRLLLGNRLLRAISLAGAMRNFFGGGFFGTLYTYYALNELHLSPFVIGLLIGAGGAGGLIGAVYAERAARRFGLGRTIILASLLPPAVPLTPLAFGPLPLVIAMMLASQFFGDILWAIHSINEVSLRQSYIPNRLIGRVAAANQFLSEAAIFFGSLAAGALATIITARWSLLVADLGMVVATLWLIFSPLPQIREQPGAEELAV